jgi:hypothetical protein
MEEETRKRLRAARIYSILGVSSLVLPFFLVILSAYMQLNDWGLTMLLLLAIIILVPVSLILSLIGLWKYRHLIRNGMESIRVRMMCAVDIITILADIFIILLLLNALISPLNMRFYVEQSSDFYRQAAFFHCQALSPDTRASRQVYPQLNPIN